MPDKQTEESLGDDGWEIACKLDPSLRDAEKPRGDISTTVPGDAVLDRIRREREERGKAN